MRDQLGKTLQEWDKSDACPLMAALLGKLLYSCFLSHLHHPTDHPVTDVATSSFALFAVCLGFFPSNDTQHGFSLTSIIHNKGLLLLPEVAPTALVCWRTKWLTSTRFYFLQEGSNAASFLQLLPHYFHTRLMTLIVIHRALCPLGPL